MMGDEVPKYLYDNLGLGDFPLVRRRLYSRLAQLVTEKGPDVMEVIIGLVAEAKVANPKRPDIYFCWVVTRRLVEMGYWTRLAGNKVPPGAAAQIVKELAQRAAKPLPEGTL